jgi:predicted O-methyltransferase YrrM
MRRSDVATLGFAKPLQHEDELEGLIDLFQTAGVRSYLEIGVRYGGSFERIVESLPKGSRGVAVDFPGGAFGDEESAPILCSALRRLKFKGYLVKSIFGPSQAPEVIERVKRFAPFDAVLLDADHSYEAIRKDFEVYAPMSKLVVLHDVAAPETVRSKDGLSVEVPRFWQEIKKSYPHWEIARSASLMGMGVLFWRP